MFYVHLGDITCTPIDLRQRTPAFYSTILINITEKPEGFVFKF